MRELDEEDAYSSESNSWPDESNSMKLRISFHLNLIPEIERWCCTTTIESAEEADAPQNILIRRFDLPRLVSMVTPADAVDLLRISKVS